MTMQGSGTNTIDIPDPDQDIKRERNANSKDCIKYNVTKSESEENSPFPEDGYHNQSEHKVEDRMKSQWSSNDNDNIPQ